MSGAMSVDEARKLYDEVVSSQGEESSDYDEAVPEEKQEARQRPTKAKAKAKKDDRGASCKRWCWTYHRPADGYKIYPATNKAYDVMKRNPGKKPAPCLVTFTCYQEEEAPTTKKHHLQGYCEFG